MALRDLISFNGNNKRRLVELFAGHLLWCLSLPVILVLVGKAEKPSPFWSIALMTLQLYFAGQLIIPALRMEPENRNRVFYVFWGAVLAVMVWAGHQLSANGLRQPLFEALQSGLLLLTGTIIGAALARYVKKLWEILPLCLAMSLADFSSWLIGPTADFARTIEQYYLKPVGPPPAIDMILIKVTFPGAPNLLPIFGLSDWIMVTFFAVIAQRHQINDNLLTGRRDGEPKKSRRPGIYLPISLVALLGAVALAQLTGTFIPALPVIALVMLAWVGGQSLTRKVRHEKS